MVKIIITPEIRSLVHEYAPKQTIGGYSNLKRFDINKSTRLDFQYTGLYGEAAWYSYRYNSIQKLKELMDRKNEHFAATRKGDDGFDDQIVFCGEQRLLDIKSTHVDTEEKIAKLNLVIPPRELHPKMIYVAAFTIGTDRQTVQEVMLTGWCRTEDVKDKWHYDRDKFAVKVANLKPTEDLRKYFEENNESNIDPIV